MENFNINTEKRENMIISENDLNQPIKREPYYVFLDIDGTLWDYKTNFEYYGNMTNYVDYPILKKSSIEAVNTLLASLEKKYDTKLVITSRRRKNLPKCIEYLNENGLKYSKSIFATIYPSRIIRGDNILYFMENDGDHTFHYNHLKNKIGRFFSRFFNINNDFKNYVVLEDEISIVNKYIPMNRILKADHNKRAITPTQVKRYLIRNGVKVNDEKDLSKSEKQK